MLEIIVQGLLNLADMHMSDIRSVPLRKSEKKWRIEEDINLPGMTFSGDLCSFLKVGKSRNDVCLIALNGVTMVKFVGST